MEVRDILGSGSKMLGNNFAQLVAAIEAGVKCQIKVM